MKTNKSITSILSALVIALAFSSVNVNAASVNYVKTADTTKMAKDKMKMDKMKTNKMKGKTEKMKMDKKMKKDSTSKM